MTLRVVRAAMLGLALGLLSPLTWPLGPYLTSEGLEVWSDGRESFTALPLHPAFTYDAIVTGVLEYRECRRCSVSYADAAYHANYSGRFTFPFKALNWTATSALVDEDRATHTYHYRVAGTGKLSVHIGALDRAPESVFHVQIERERLSFLSPRRGRVRLSLGLILAILLARPLSRCAARWVLYRARRKGRERMERAKKLIAEAQERRLRGLEAEKERAKAQVRAHELAIERAKREAEARSAEVRAREAATPPPPEEPTQHEKDRRYRKRQTAHIRRQAALERAKTIERIRAREKLREELAKRNVPEDEMTRAITDLEAAFGKPMKENDDD